MPDEPAAPATGTEPPAPSAPPAEPEPAQPEPATGEPDAPSPPSATDSRTADEAAKWKALARKHEDQNKATRSELEKVQAALAADKDEQARRMDAFAVALGLKSGDEPPDPAKLAEELERSREQHKAELERQAAEIRQRDLRLAVLTQAPSLDANGALLMDSMSFLGKINGLDPSAEDFGERLGEAIKAAAEANAQYRLAPAPAPEQPKPPPAVARSGGEHNGTPGGNRQLNLADVEHMLPREVAEAQDAGLLMDLGFAPRKKRF